MFRPMVAKTCKSKIFNYIKLVKLDGIYCLFMYMLPLNSYIFDSFVFIS
jgi:hypothetical protein